MFNGNIPQPPDLLMNSQGEMLANFAELILAIANNHVSFGLPGEGNHKWLSIPVDPNPTNPVPDANDLVMKCTTSRFTNLPELTFQRTGSTRQFPITLRQNGLNANLAPGFATLGGSNIIIKWGYSSGTGFSFVHYPRNDGIPLFSAAPFAVQVSTLASPGFNTNINAQLVSSNLLDFFTVSCTRRTEQVDTLVPFFWMAIGPT